VSEFVYLTCPNCQRPNLKVRPEYLGQLLRCKSCNHKFRAEASGSVETKEPVASASLPERLDVVEHERDEALRVRDEAADRADAFHLELETVRTDRDRLVVERAGLLTRIEALEHEREGARASSTQLAAHEAEKEALRVAVANHEAEAEALRVALAAATAQHSTLVNEYDALRGECGRLTRALNEAQSDLQQETARISALEDDLAAARTIPAPPVSPLPTPRVPVPDLPPPSLLETLRLTPAVLGGPAALGQPAAPAVAPGGRVPAWPLEESIDGAVTEQDEQIAHLFDMTVALKGEVETLTEERDHWKAEADRARAQARPSGPGAAGSDAEAVKAIEKQLASVYAALEAEKARTGSLQSQLSEMHAAAIAELSSEDDVADETMALSRQLADARADLLRLRARLLALGDDPDQRNG
jgi:chromosome segregation ATPase